MIIVIITVGKSSDQYIFFTLLENTVKLDSHTYGGSAHSELDIRELHDN